MRSKKNRVFRAAVGEREYVVKVFRGEWKDRARVEFGVLSECHRRGVPAPVPVAIVEDAIVMEPVVGDPVAEVFDGLFSRSSEADLSEGQGRLADSLAEWLSAFHAAFDFGLARGDTILKNFMTSPSGVIGLDFEEASPVDTITDLGQMCASPLMTDPPFTDAKAAFAGRLAEKYWERSGLDRSGDLNRAVSAAIRQYAPFRANGGELLGYASRIENGNLSIF